MNGGPSAAAPLIGDKRLAELWRHWLEARSVRMMPARRDIDAARIPSLLAHLFVYDYHPDPDRFYCRLAGEDIFAAAGIRGARKFLDELFVPPMLERVRDRYRRVIGRPGSDRPMILHSRGLLRVASGYRIPGERLVLPLANDGETADGLVGATIYRRNEALSPMHAMSAPLATEARFALPPPG